MEHLSLIYFKLFAMELRQFKLVLMHSLPMTKLMGVNNWGMKFTDRNAAFRTDSTDEGITY